MKLSKESQYGLAGLAYLAAQPPGTVLQAAQLAEAKGLPRTFLAKTLRKLTRSGILRSFRGKERGYGLARPARDISVKEALEAIEGPDLFQRCIFWSDVCSDSNPCLLHETWKVVRPTMAALMARLSLEDVANGHPVPGLDGAPRAGSRGAAAGRSTPVRHRAGTR